MTAPADTLVERLEKESNDIRSVHQIRGADLIVWHRTMAEASARIRELEAQVAAADRAIGDHHAPADCYSTGPLTGDPIADLVECPACAYLNLRKESK